MPNACTPNVRSYLYGIFGTACYYTVFHMQAQAENFVIRTTRVSTPSRSFLILFIAVVVIDEATLNDNISLIRCKVSEFQLKLLEVLVYYIRFNA